MWKIILPISCCPKHAFMLSRITFPTLFWWNISPVSCTSYKERTAKWMHYQWIIIPHKQFWLQQHFWSNFVSSKTWAVFIYFRCFAVTTSLLLSHSISATNLLHFVTRSYCNKVTLLKFFQTNAGQKERSKMFLSLFWVMVFRNRYGMCQACSKCYSTLPRLNSY